MKDLHKITGVSIILFSLICQINAQSHDSIYSLKLTRETGYVPLPIRTNSWSHYLTTSKPLNIPAFLTDYKCYSIPFLGNQTHASEFESSDSLMAICGLHNGQKVVIVDANNNKDLSDDKVFRFEYDRTRYLTSDEPPDKFQIDEWTKLDKYPGNEIFLNYNLYRNQEEFSNQVLVEVIPNFFVVPNPTGNNYQQELNLFDYTFMLVLAEYRKADFEYENETYQLFFQQQSSTHLFDIFRYYVRIKQPGAPNVKFEDILSYPHQKIIIGNGVFDVKIDYNGENATLKLINTKTNYNDSIDKVNPHIIPFRRTSFLDNSKVAFPSNNNLFTLIHFWGSWCAPCKDQMPALVRMWNNYEDTMDFIGIASEHRIDLDQLRQITEKHSIQWSQIADNLTSADGLANAYGIGVFPTYILVSKTGDLVLRTSKISDLDAKLVEILK